MYGAKTTLIQRTKRVCESRFVRRFFVLFVAHLVVDFVVQFAFDLKELQIGVVRTAARRFGALCVHFREFFRVDRFAAPDAFQDFGRFHFFLSSKNEYHCFFI